MPLQGLEMSLTNETGADGRAKDIVTIEAKSGLPTMIYQKLVRQHRRHAPGVCLRQSERTAGIGEDLFFSPHRAEVDFLAGPD